MSPTVAQPVVPRPLQDRMATLLEAIACLNAATRESMWTNASPVQNLISALLAEAGLEEADKHSNVVSLALRSISLIKELEKEQGAVNGG